MYCVINPNTANASQLNTILYVWFSPRRSRYSRLNGLKSLLIIYSTAITLTHAPVNEVISMIINFWSNKARIPPTKAGKIYRIGLVLLFTNPIIPENRRIPNIAPTRNTPAEYKKRKRAPTIKPPATAAINITTISSPSVRVKPKPATNDAPIINPTIANTNLKILYPKKTICPIKNLGL